VTPDTLVQRFGSSLNLHIHLHVCALDGVFTEHADALRFVPAAPPTRAELSAIVERVYARAVRWLEKKRYITRDDEANESNDTPQRAFEELLALTATQRGTMEKLRDDTGDKDDDDALDAPPAPRTQDAVKHMGFNLPSFEDREARHAGERIEAHDDLGRERLFRYALRPPFALSRLRRLADGRIAYRVKKSSRGRARCRVMTPVECIARPLCAHSATTLPADALPWCARAARETPPAHRAEAPAERAERTARPARAARLRRAERTAPLPAEAR
jgi:hypothetical protein